MDKGKVIKVAELESFMPPAHTNTDAWIIINKDTVGAKLTSFSLTEIRPGGEAEETTHPGAEHGLFILSGIGEAVVQGEKFIVHPYECIWVPPGAKHSLKPIGNQTLRALVFSVKPEA